MPEPEPPPRPPRRPATGVNAAIRARMGPLRMTQRQLASALGISPAGVSARMTGQQDWRVTELGVVARVLGCDPGELYAAPFRNVRATPDESPSVSEQPPESLAV
jgi:transcriptional regulator with XRE-family HTH domain